MKKFLSLAFVMVMALALLRGCAQYTATTSAGATSAATEATTSGRDYGWPAATWVKADDAANLIVIITPSH